jgi:hypothetical protein
MRWLALTGFALAVRLGQLRKLVKRDEPPPELEALRGTLDNTMHVMEEAEAAALGHEESNRMLQNLIVVAMRQVRALAAKVDTLSPALASCLAYHRPTVQPNATGQIPSAAVLAANGANATHALRAEMHSTRDLDHKIADLKKEIEECSKCRSPGLALASVRQLPDASPLGAAPLGSATFMLSPASPLIPQLTDELNAVAQRFTQLTNAARAASASGDVMEGMSAEAVKASFNLQDEVDELNRALISCGNEAAPFHFHEEVEVHFDDYSEVAETMIKRARAETAERGMEIAPLEAELAQCKANCEVLSLHR